MSDAKIGYGNPPAAFRFKPGKSGNDKGRPPGSVRKPAGLAAIILSAINEPIEYRTRGGTMAAPGQELDLKMLVARAVEGNIDAISAVLSELTDAARAGSTEVDRFEISNWIPDYAGQTADQKTQDSAAKIAATPQEWWKADAVFPGKA
jgi:hypothetical protein